MSRSAVECWSVRLAAIGVLAALAPGSAGARARETTPRTRPLAHGSVRAAHGAARRGAGSMRSLAPGPVGPSPRPESPPGSAAFNVVVRFCFDRARLRRGADAALRNLAHRISAHRGIDVRALRIEIHGHTDARGRAGYNVGLSARRARTVARRLTRLLGLPRRPRYVAYGEARPAAPNRRPEGRDDPAGRARNRRVWIRISAPCARGC
jgi:outer membrane protein OmpA-like peptidoglycan-associated protein